MPNPIEEQEDSLLAILSNAAWAEQLCNHLSTLWRSHTWVEFYRNQPRALNFDNTHVRVRLRRGEGVTLQTHLDKYHGSVHSFLYLLRNNLLPEQTAPPAATTPPPTNINSDANAYTDLMQELEVAPEDWPQMRHLLRDWKRVRKLKEHLRELRQQANETTTIWHPITTWHRLSGVFVRRQGQLVEESYYLLTPRNESGICLTMTCLDAVVETQFGTFPLDGEWLYWRP